MLPFSTWEWLVPTVLVTFWVLAPLVSMDLFLTSTNNEVADASMAAAEASKDPEEGATEDGATPTPTPVIGSPRSPRAQQRMASLTRSYFPPDPRLTPKESLFVRGLTDSLLFQKKQSVFAQYKRMKQAFEIVIVLYEAYNLWSCLFQYSIYWSDKAPTKEVFLYGTLKLYDAFNASTYLAVLAIFMLAAFLVILKDYCVTHQEMRQYRLRLRTRLVTSPTWREFTSHEWGTEEVFFHVQLFIQYLFFEFLFMPGLSISLGVLNCVQVNGMSGVNGSGSGGSREYRMRGDDGIECWNGAHEIYAIVGVLTSTVIYSCALWHMRQKMRKSSTIVYNFPFELFYTMMKALLTGIAVGFPEAHQGKLLLWTGLSIFALLCFVNFNMQPCKGYGTVINSIRTVRESDRALTPRPRAPTHTAPPNPPSFSSHDYVTPARS